MSPSVSTESVSNGSTCPICNEGSLIFTDLGPVMFITCCVCAKMWMEHEFRADWQNAVTEAELRDVPVEA